MLDPFKEPDVMELAEYRAFVCENCGEHVFWGGRHPERNHCLIPDRKRYHNVVTVGINLELVCNVCHQLEHVHTYEHRVEFKRKQEQRYGVQTVADFLSQAEMAGYISDGIVEA